MEKKSGIPPIPPEEIQRLLESTAPAIHRHVASVHLIDGSVFSGVYAKSFGYEGILTAGHCASDFLTAERIALPVSELMHQLWVESNAFEHVPIGYDEIEGYAYDQPDLSFVIIRDGKLLRTIKSQNIEFYDLDRNGARVKEIFGSDLNKFHWCVAGHPGEQVQETKRLVDGQLHKFVETTASVIQGVATGYDFRNNFDYVTLLLGSGFEEFPTSYSGVSGGGIWYQRFVTDDGKTCRVELILAGVVCWESDPTVKKGYKVRPITGHGWVSVYGQVRKALYDKRALENKKSAET